MAAAHMPGSLAGPPASARPGAGAMIGVKPSLFWTVSLAIRAPAQPLLGRPGGKGSRKA